MGTSFDIYLYASSSARASEIFEEAFAQIERLEAQLSNYRPASELSRINARAAFEPVVTDAEVFGLLERAFDYSRKTGGAFDMTVGRLMKAWGFFRGAGRYPTDEELARVREQTGWRRVRLDRRARSVRFLAQGLELDPGGIGKGYAIDSVVRLLKESGVKRALVGAGTSSYYGLGSPPGKAGWVIKIPDPLDRARLVATVLLSDLSLSTSGSYEKFFRLNGRTYCHIMNPLTGRPVEGMLQSTVIAPRAIDSDALSTSVFVMRPEASARLLDKMKGVSALLVTNNTGANRVVRIRWSDSAPKLAPPLRDGAKGFQR
jgi:thiamine biosynthesis lipoprotein